MGKVLYSFAAKEIQTFILQSDKLREMIGGSELVNRLCGDYLDTVLRELDLEGRYQEIGRAAGWAKLLFDSEEDGQKLYRHWPLLADRFAPGLKVVQSLVSTEQGLADALQAGALALESARSQVHARLPEAGPLVDRSPRTGLPAVAYGGKKKSLIDAGTQRKLAMTESKNSLLTNMFGKEQADSTHWTDDINNVAGGENSYVAVIHADGNDLGQRVLAISKELQKKGQDAGAVFKNFSLAIEESNRQGIQAAFNQVLQPDLEERRAAGHGDHYAARPIVFGGDDLTIIVRADLAFAFTEAFLKAFEQASQEQMNLLVEQHGLDSLSEGVTACAGIALVKKNFPFSAAYELAESLCVQSKKSAERHKSTNLKPSCFSFHRVSTSICGDYNDIQKQELTSRSQDDLTVLFWMGPYGVGEHAAGLPSYEALTQLGDCMHQFPSGSIRTLLSTLKETPGRAADEYQRILQIARDKHGTRQKDDLKTCLCRLTGDSDSDLWNSAGHTPLLEAHILKGLALKPQKGASHV